MPPLQIYDRRERALVTTADVAMGAARALAAPFRKRVPPAAPDRILLLRLERIGDLLMALPGIAAVRQLAPNAAIDLVVGSWNVELARAIPSVDRVIAADAKWLARDGEGLGVGALVRTARAWRSSGYDLALNFEPDIRSNLMLAAAGAGWTAGYRSGGGGALLDQALEYDPTAHTSDNARRLVAAVFNTDILPTAATWLTVPDPHRERARTILGHTRHPIVAMHVSGGRPVKQWDPARFADVANRLARRGATIVFTGTFAERALIESVTRTLPVGSYVDVSSERSLLTLAALLQEADVMVTGDTGPMHIAAAVGTPIVAVFGASDPRRYAPRGPLDRVVRVDLPCAPCNRIRLPPARCTGVIPDCLALIPADRVFETVSAVLDQCVPSPVRGASA